MQSHPRPARRLSLALVFLVLASMGAGSPVAASGPLPDWDALRPALFDLEAYAPGSTEPTHGIGFALEGVDGIVTCHQFVKGATRVVARSGRGAATEISEYVAHDAAADLILLAAPVGEKRLARGTHRVLSIGQTIFALLPPPAPQAAQPITYYTTFEGAGVGELLAVGGGQPTGAVLADSLGRVIGIVQNLSDGAASAGAAVPIDRIQAMLASPELGGPLSALAGEEIAPWTRAETAAGQQALGGALGRARRFAEAVPYLTRAFNQDGTMASALLEWGMALQGQAQYVQAEEKYRQAIRIAPRHSRAHLYLGSCLHMQGLYGQAEETYETAIGFDPDNAQLHVNLGGIYFLQKKPADAERAFRQALVVDPQLGIAHYNLGVLLANQGRRQEALAELEFLRSVRSGFAPQMEKFTGR